MRAESSRPRIAVACADCRERAGSVATVAIHQAAELARQFEVTILSDRLPERPPYGVTTAAVAERRYTLLRRFAHVPAQYLFARRVGRELIRQHRVQPLAAVICHSHALAVAGALRLRRAAGVPFAMVTHGDIFDRPAGTYDPRLTRFFRRMTPPAYREADRILALSPYMAELARRGGAVDQRICLVPNGIEPSEIGVDIGRSRLGTSPAGASVPLRILCVGHFGVEKGVGNLIAACRRLAHSGIAFELDLVGEGPRRAELDARVVASGLGQSVRFLGRLPRASLGELYSRVDIVVVPSLSESLATVVLEALVAECPVVASDTGGNPFMVRDGENGVLFPVGDEAALAAALERLARDRPLLERLARGARPSVWPAFSWSARGELLTEVIAEMIAERGTE